MAWLTSVHPGFPQQGEDQIILVWLNKAISARLPLRAFDRQEVAMKAS
jgi:hypothetical protein